MKIKEKNSFSFVIFITVFILIFMFGCHTQENDVFSHATERLPAFPSNTAIPQPINEQPTPSLRSTDISIAPSPITEPTVIPTVMLPDNLEIQCLEIRNQIQEVHGLTGTLLVETAEGKNTFLLDLSTLEKTALINGEGRYTLDEIFSPNRQWLAYKDTQENQITIENIDNSSASTSVNWEDDWFRLQEWVDNQRILISLSGGGFLVINPFTNERNLVASDFPDQAQPIGAGADWWEITYNPLLTHAVYQALYGDFQGAQIALWNIKENKPVAFIKSQNSPYGERPVWSPEGDDFVMALQRQNMEGNSLNWELFKITKDGDITKLTALSSYYPIHRMSDYSWSPDGSKIAFWIHYEINVERKDLVILSLETLQVSNYCIQGHLSRGYDEPVWSLNNHQLFVYSKTHSGTVLLDIDENQAFLIGTDIYPLGWLAWP